MINSGRVSLLHPECGSHSNHWHVQNTNLFSRAGQEPISTQDFTAQGEIFEFWVPGCFLAVSIWRASARGICCCCSELLSAPCPPAVFLVRSCQGRAQNTPLISEWLCDYTHSSFIFFFLMLQNSFMLLRHCDKLQQVEGRVAFRD